MNELKSCPFCGGTQEEKRTDSALRIEPYHAYENDKGVLVYSWFVTCHECFASMQGETEHEARQKWNRRADAQMNAIQPDTGPREPDFSL